MEEFVTRGDGHKIETFVYEPNADHGLLKRLMREEEDVIKADARFLRYNDFMAQNDPRRAYALATLVADERPNEWVPAFFRGTAMTYMNAGDAILILERALTLATNPYQTAKTQKNLADAHLQRTTELPPDLEKIATLERTRQEYMRVKSVHLPPDTVLSCFMNISATYLDELEVLGTGIVGAMAVGNADQVNVLAKHAKKLVNCAIVCYTHGLTLAENIKSQVYVPRFRAVIKHLERHHRSR